MPAAARAGDMHICPAFDGATAHGGGPVSVGCLEVLIGGQPAARIGDLAVCAGPPDAVAMGSFTVFIGGRPAARLGDATAHGGRLTVGYPYVQIG